MSDSKNFYDGYAEAMEDKCNACSSNGSVIKKLESQLAQSKEREKVLRDAVERCIDGNIPVEGYALAVNLILNKAFGEIKEMGG